jgi:phage FluMu protein Com
MKTVKCSKCKRRLFDITEESQAVIEIKCPRCGETIVVKVNKVA